MRARVDNVYDRRYGWIGAWDVEPLDIDKLTPADIGRTVIYRDHGRAEAGTLTSWRDGIVFARYSTGDTAAGANASDLVFAVRRGDVALSHPTTEPAKAWTTGKEPIPDRMIDDGRGEHVRLTTEPAKAEEQ